jgi:hypothetical protein
MHLPLLHPPLTLHHLLLELPVQIAGPSQITLIHVMFPIYVAKECLAVILSYLIIRNTLIFYFVILFWLSFCFPVGIKSLQFDAVKFCANLFSLPFTPRCSAARCWLI